MRSITKARVIAESLLGPGEHLEQVAIALPGRDPTGRMLKSAALSGGFLIALPRRGFLVVTDARLLILAEAFGGAPTKQIMFQAPRQLLQVVGARGRFPFRKVTLASCDGEAKLQLNFPWALRRQSAEFEARFARS